MRENHGFCKSQPVVFQQSLFYPPPAEWGNRLPSHWVQAFEFPGFYRFHGMDKVVG